MIEDAIPPKTTYLYNRLNLRIKLQQLQENTFHRIVGLRPASFTRWSMVKRLCGVEGMSFDIFVPRLPPTYSV